MTPPLLFLHAFPLDARMWELQIAAFEQVGYETIAPNLPGREPDDDLGSWAERILQLHSGPFVPVGCSMGGYLTFELWRRDSSRIPGAVFIDTRAGADTPEVREGREETIRVLREEGFEAFWELQKPKLFTPKTPPDVVERARTIAVEQPIANLVGTVRALAARPDSHQTASTMNIPALVMVGEDDSLTPPADAAELTAHLPDGKLVTIQEAGHLTPLEKSEAVNEELFLFLTKTFPPGA